MYDFLFVCLLVCFCFNVLYVFHIYDNDLVRMPRTMTIVCFHPSRLLTQGKEKRERKEHDDRQKCRRSCRLGLGGRCHFVIARQLIRIL